MRSALLVALTAAAACGPTVAGSAGSSGAASSSGPAPVPVGTPVSRAGRGPALAYQPYQGNRGLVVHQLDSLTFELPGGSSYVQAFGRSAYLTFQFSPATTGSHAVITLDSIRLDPGQGSLPIPFDSIRAAEGARWTADLLPTGRLANVTASDSGVVASQMGGDLQLLFPVLPPGGARSGAEWTDTSQTVITTSVVNTHRTASWQYRGIGFEQRGGSSPRGFQIEATDSLAQTGTGNQFGTTIQMTGHGSGEASYFLAEDGWPIRAAITSHLSLMLTNPTLGQTVPATQASSITVSDQSAAH